MSTPDVPPTSGVCHVICIKQHFEVAHVVALVLQYMSEAVTASEITSVKEI